MKILYKTGNIINAEEYCVCHGVNASGRMASGCAKVIRATYPEAYTAYMKASKTDGLHLGDVIWAASKDKLIANGVTQQFYGYDNNTYIDYDAINRVMETVHNEAVSSKFSVAFPLIGSGLGGGSWKKISGIIQDVFTDIVPVVYTIDGIVPTS